MEPIYLIPFALFFAAGLLAYVLGRKVGGWSVAIGTGVLAAIGGVLMVMANQASGYSGLGYAIFSVFGAAPAAVGFLAGGVFGWSKGRGAGDEASPL